MLLAEGSVEPTDFMDKHSASLTILIVTAMGFGTLLLLVPRLLRGRQQRLEMFHAERMKALEMGHQPPHPDERSIAAGRTASLVPIIVMCATGAVTCFLAAYRPDNLFAVGLAAWTVSGAVSLAAITGGVALMGRIAHLNAGVEEEVEEPPEEEIEEPAGERRDGRS
jgi:hypothetical protein